MTHNKIKNRLKKSSSFGVLPSRVTNSFRKKILLKTFKMYKQIKTK